MSIQWLRSAVLLILIGIFLEFLSFLRLTPGTFLLFVCVGVPCLLAGIGIYLAHVLRRLKQSSAL